MSSALVREKCALGPYSKDKSTKFQHSSPLDFIPKQFRIRPLEERHAISPPVDPISINWANDTSEEYDSDDPEDYLTGPVGVVLESRLGFCISEQTEQHADIPLPTAFHRAPLWECNHALSRHQGTPGFLEEDVDSSFSCKLHAATWDHDGWPPILRSAIPSPPLPGFDKRAVDSYSLSRPYDGASASYTASPCSLARPTSTCSRRKSLEQNPIYANRLLPDHRYDIPPPPSLAQEGPSSSRQKFPLQALRSEPRYGITSEEVQIT